MYQMAKHERPSKMYLESDKLCKVIVRLSCLI